MTPLIRRTPTPGKRNANEGSPARSLSGTLRWGGLGIGAIAGAIGAVYYTLVPLLLQFIDFAGGKGWDPTIVGNLLLTVFALVLAFFLGTRGVRYLHAAYDPFAREELVGAMVPRVKEFRYSLHLLRRSSLAMVGLAIVLFYVLIAAFGPYIAPFPYDPSFHEFHVAPGTGALDTETLAATAYVNPTSWVNTSNVFKSDGNYALSNNTGQILVLTGFRIPLVFSSSTVQAVDVGVQYYSPEGQTLSVAVSWDQGSHWSSDQSLPVKSQDNKELWYLSYASAHAWTPQELNQSEMWVRLTHIQGSGPIQGTGYVDVVQARSVMQGPIHPWGTNELGEDVLAGVLLGTRVDLRVGILVVFGAVAIGVVLGVFSGYFGGWSDEILMRITDMFLAVPGLILALAFAALLGRNLENILIALMLVSWPGYTRLVRGQVLSVREISYVEAARAVGAKTRRIVMKHILPNVLSVVIVASTLDLGTIVISTAALSFLGLGAPSYAAEWGIMIARGYPHMLSGFWWEYMFPGLAIFFFVMAFNLFGDGLRDILDPRLRR